MVTLPDDSVRELVGSCHSVDAKIGLYEQPNMQGPSAINTEVLTTALGDIGIMTNSIGMLSNGGRLYMDPSGPEYATPETTTAEEAVHRSFDGDDILMSVMMRLRASGVISGAQVNRRIVDHNRTSRGVHLNTYTSLEHNANRNSARLIDWLATLNVVKGSMFGSGGLLLDEHGNTQYHHSPRLSLTSTLSSDYWNYRRRPLVRTPFKEDGGGYRIETVTSDALNFAWPMRASLVATNALVKLFETGRTKDMPLLNNYVRSAHIVGCFGNTNQISTSLSNSPEIRTGVKPSEIMTRICELILNADSRSYFLDAESKQVLPEIIDVAERLQKDPLSVAGQVESVARWAAIRRKMDKDKLTLDSERICRFDYYWDVLDKHGPAQRIRQNNIGGSWLGFSQPYSLTATENRKKVPPQDTRAKLRGAIIANGDGELVTDWGNLRPANVDEADIDTHTYLSPLDTVL